MFEIRKNPTPRELKLFGLALATFFGVAGALLRWKWGFDNFSLGLWIGAAGLLLLYLTIPGVRLPVYLGWSYLTFPVGWLVSHLVLAAVFFVVVTPVGWILRLLGKDPMRRRFDRQADSYWIEHRPRDDVESYFRQY